MARAPLFTLIVWMLLAPAVAAADTITIRAAPWCPYVCEPGSGRPGYLIEIAERVFAAAGHGISYQRLPYVRAIAETRRGVFNAVAGSGREDTPDFVLSKSMGVHIPGFAMRKGSGFKFEGIKSLEQIRLSTTAGVASWGGGLDEYIAANKDNPARIDLTGSEEAVPVSIRKLLAGRVDAVANNVLVLKWVAAELRSIDRLEFHAISENDDVYYAFSPALPSSAMYVRLLDEGVDRLRASGELAKIMARYSLIDWVR